MTDLPILYSFRRCPYAMRARMALVMSGLICELREVVLVQKPAALIQASAKGTVPVLAIPNGKVIDESIDIMRWALGHNDPENWLSIDEQSSALIERNDGAFKHHLDRYKYPDRYGADANIHRVEGLKILADLEARLQKRANLCRETRSLADIAIMPFVRQFAATDRAWFGAQPLPALQVWLERHSTDALFEQTMMRAPSWQPDDAVVLFPLKHAEKML